MPIIVCSFLPFLEWTIRRSGQYEDREQLVWFHCWETIGTVLPSFMKARQRLSIGNKDIISRLWRIRQYVISLRLYNFYQHFIRYYLTLYSIASYLLSSSSASDTRVITWKTNDKLRVYHGWAVRMEVTLRERIEKSIMINQESNFYFMRFTIPAALQLTPYLWDLAEDNRHLPLIAIEGVSVVRSIH